MVKRVKFAHVVYMTRRFDEMIAWYRSACLSSNLRIEHSKTTTPLQAAP